MLSTRRNSFGTLVLLGMLLSPTVVLADSAKVAVVDTVRATLRMKLGIRQAVASALDELSVAMVPLEDLTPEDATCADADCFVALAKRVEATHILVVQGVANPAGYRLSLEVRDGENGRSLGSDGKDCELCAEDQFVPAVQDKVKKLWARVMLEQAPKPPAMSPVPEAAPGQNPGVDVSAVRPWYQQPTPMMGAGFGAAGLLAIGFGVYYMAVDGNTVETSKSNGKPIILRDTGKWGWSLLGVGAVSLAAGSTMLIWGRDDGNSVSVAVGPASLGLQGKF
jgi:hypothetical protein